MKFTKESLWAELDGLGEGEVRARLATKIYGDVGHKRELVLEWIRRREENRAQDSDRSSRDSSLEQIRIARSAKNAAWAAAIAAIIAAICAIIVSLS